MSEKNTIVSLKQLYNRIKLRRGSGTPTAEQLEEFELGYSTSENRLYTKVGNDIRPIAEKTSLSDLGVTASSEELNKLQGATVTTQELNFSKGVTSPIQTQLDGKAKGAHNHSTSDVTSGTLPIERGGTGVTSVAEIGLLSYPVGSIYVSTNSTSPAALFGGTWTQIKDRFLLGAGDSYANGATGGEATHTLTINEMPNHDHTVRTTRTESYPAYWHSTHTGSTDSSKGWAYLSTAGSANSGVGSLYVEKVGGGAAHDNMPPYLAVYIWQRTA